MEGFEVQNDCSLVEALVALGGYSTRTKARKAIKNGAVKLDGKVVKIPSATVNPGMKISHDRNRNAKKKTNTQSSVSKSSKAPFEIVFENDNFLAYVKPSGCLLYTSPSPRD